EVVRRLEEAGAEVVVCAADVSDEAQMRRAVAEGEGRFGPVNGIIHAAGVPGGGAIETKTSEMADRVLAPKVKGTLVLDALFEGRELDFFVLCSSLSAVTGLFWQADYSAANAFLDAFAHRNNLKGKTHTVSINWDSWQDVGMAIDSAAELNLMKWREKSLKDAISPQEGVEAFKRILAHPLPQVLVSTQDLQAVIDLNNDLIASSAAGAHEAEASQRADHARPVLRSNYVAPTNDIERTIIEIWKELLGFTEIGIYDNFLELGGHSLLAIQLISRLRETFNVEIPVGTLFEAPVVADLALVILQELMERQGGEKLEQMLDRLQGGAEAGGGQAVTRQTAPEPPGGDSDGRPW
ncbi:MAG TPA: SDR family NAD(P)-dependent oxidoreductase, partial [Pyrinomonadaceae bacterium]